MSSQQLTPEQEAEAQALAARVQEAVKEEIVRMARLLAGKPTRDLFGPTELEMRERVFRIAVQTYELHLAEKKTATSVPASSAPTVTRRPSSRTTGPKRS